MIYNVDRSYWAYVPGITIEKTGLNWTKKKKFQFLYFFYFRIISPKTRILNKFKFDPHFLRQRPLQVGK
jgi:hypothetical protein